MTLRLCAKEPLRGQLIFKADEGEADAIPIVILLHFAERILPSESVGNELVFARTDRYSVKGHMPLHAQRYLRSWLNPLHPFHSYCLPDIRSRQAYPQEKDEETLVRRTKDRPELLIHR